MNERIRKLAYDAEDYADTMVDGGSEFHSTFVKKFAELIIGECIRLCDQVDVVGADECIDNIKEHFGVEE